MRLSEIGNDKGVLSSRYIDVFCKKKIAVENEIERLGKTFEGSISLAQVLRRNDVNYEPLPQRDEALTEEVRRQVEITVKYAGYVERQEVEVARFRTMEDKQIPDWLDYAGITGLRNEARQKLIDHQPATLGQASRISGISPSDISLVMVHMKRGPKKTKAAGVSE